MSPIKHCRFTSSKQVCRLPHRPCQWSTEPVDCRVQTEINPKLPTNTIIDAYRSYPSYRSISKQQLCGLVSLVLSNTYLVQVSPTLVPVLTLLRRERSVVCRSAARVRVTCAAGYGVTDLGNSLTSQRPTLNPLISIEHL